MKTKELIKKEALYLFATLGYEATALSQIADRVGIRKASLYSHYQKKEELFLEIYNEELDSRLNHFAMFLSVNNYGSIENRLFELYKSYVEYYSENIVSAEFLARFSFFPPKELKEGIFSCNDIKYKRINFFEKLVVLFDEGKKNNEIREVDTKGFLTSYYWLCNLSVLKISSFGRKYSLEEIKEEWELYFSGIKKM